jgi:hypothetical protein
MLSINGLNGFVQWRALEIIDSLLLSFLDHKVPKLSLRMYIFLDVFEEPFFGN